MDLIDSAIEGASDVWNNFDLNEFITTAANAYKTVKQANVATQLVPGTIKTLPDGSTARVNADGSLTVISRAGMSQTITPSGNIFSGAISPAVLMIGGVAVIGAILLMRKGKR